jgi:hypothetical protein
MALINSLSKPLDYVLVLPPMLAISGRGTGGQFQIRRVLTHSHLKFKNLLLLLLLQRYLHCRLPLLWS